MTLIQVWGCLLIFVICPLLGGLPLAEWLMRRLPPPTQTGHRLFGIPLNGRLVIQMGVEASKGILSVLLARYYFPVDPTWWIIALIALVFGQFWLRQSKQLLGVMAGGVVYSWQVAFLLLLIGGIGITILRERRLGRLGILILFPIVVGLTSEQSSQAMAAMGLSFVLAWVNEQLPDPQPSASTASMAGALVTQSQADDAHLFGLFQRDRTIRTLDQHLSATEYGHPAAILSQLKRWGYHVPPGWVLPPGDDADPLIRLLAPSPERPLMIRSAVVGKQVDAAAPSPDPVFQITSRRALVQVIRACRTAYSATPSSPQHRDLGVSVMVQIQVNGHYSGFAWSQDFQASDPTAVLITGGPGQTPSAALTQPTATQIRVPKTAEDVSDSMALSPHQPLPIDLVSQIATIAQEIEAHFQGIPQKLEWSYDGTTLWLLEVQPI